MHNFKIQAFILYLLSTFVISKTEQDLLIITVASEVTDGYNRFLRSTKTFDLNVKVLGMGTQWQGGDMNQPGGGYKVNLLKKEIENLSKAKKQPDNFIVAFTDSYDVIFNGNSDEILQKFRTFGSDIVFGAEGFCWPDSSLESQYPEVTSGEYRFLNSGGFIGKLSAVQKLLNQTDIENKDDDQLFYTKIFLNGIEDVKIQLDTKAELFQNLNGAVGDVEMDFSLTEPVLKNTIHDTKPLIIHGNGPSKIVLNSLGNYLARSWTFDEGCRDCLEKTQKLDGKIEKPQVLMGIFVEQPTPFLEEFLEKINKLDYPKDKIDLYIHNTEKFHESLIQKFVEENTKAYNSFSMIDHDLGVSEEDARNGLIEKCVDTKCDYVFVVDADSHLDNANTLTLLVEQKRKVIAPMLVRPFKAWSNFWGALNNEGFYARSADYMEIVQNNRRGVWNVPYIAGCFLIEGSVISDEKTRPSFSHATLDPDMAFCSNLRDAGIFIYVSNRLDWGHLINTDDFPTKHLHNELWELENNRFDWENRYLHPNWSKSLEEGHTQEIPCPDVYWFPIVTERFADDLVAEMEAYGKWSNGGNEDNRLDGGYENVPTRDIHMNQIGYDREWMAILDAYVRPLQEKVFEGYHHIPPRSTMNFVVRYRPDEQASLRPHHDSSTYTINVALNHAGIDFEGGGCRFIRYNCSVTATKKGWMLMHPGRLTHYHEGLTTTAGTRYIMISFIDP